MRHGALLAAICGIFLPLAAHAQPVPTPTPSPTPSASPAPAEFNAELKGKLLKGLEDVLQNRAFVPGIDFKKWGEIVAKHQGDFDKAENEANFAREVNNALREFGVSHIRFLPPRAAQARVQTQALGFGITAHKSDSGLVIDTVADGSPAKDAGLKQGETITAVGGELPKDLTAIRPEPDKDLVLKVKGEDGKERDVTIKPRNISTLRLPTITPAGDDAMVFKLYTFTLGYQAKQVEDLIKQAEGKKYLIIDLRSNGGGAVRNMNHLLSLLMPDGTAFGTHVNRRMVEEYGKANSEPTTDPVKIAAWTPNKSKTRKAGIEPFKGKIAVLINRGSASASEITAAALHDCVNAVVVGAPSRGAVLASVFGRLDGGFEIQYPVSDYVTIKGVRLEGNPVQPDVKAEGRAEAGKPDPYVEAALKALRGG